MDDAGFLRDIIANPNDPVPRLIYADWLDEQGDIRGEFLRLEIRLSELSADDGRSEHSRERLLEIHEGIGKRWLAQLDRAPIENCKAGISCRCPERWELLELTADPTIRFCKVCRKEVYFCNNVLQARKLVGVGRCVVVDSRLPRTPGDLNPPLDFIGRAGVKVRPVYRTTEDSEEQDRRDARKREQQRRRRPRRRRGR